MLKTIKWIILMLCLLLWPGGSQVVAEGENFHTYGLQVNEGDFYELQKAFRSSEEMKENLPGNKDQEATGEQISEEALDFDFEADAALLMEVDTGKILFERNRHSRLYPASLTKIMTALLVMEAVEANEVHWSDSVYVSSQAASMGGSQLFLSEGDQVSLDKIFTGMMVASANDAAIAIAEHVKGSVELFVNAMNNKAAELGMRNTNFVNPHGLHHEKHYTSAHDISIMSRALFNHSRIHSYTTLWMDENFLEGEIEAGEVFLSNTNRMVRTYRGCDGLKTGFTNEAGNCIAATALRGDTRYLAVVLGVSDVDARYQAAKTLLDSGFSRYFSIPVARAGENIEILNVDKGQDSYVEIVARENLTLLCPVGEKVDYEKDIELVEVVNAPVQEGDKLGTLKAVHGDQEKVVDLIASREIPRADFWQITYRLMEAWMS